MRRRSEAAPSARGLMGHAADTLRIGMPLAAAQLAQMAMGVTDTIMLGALGPDALAAGSLGSTLEFTVLVVLQGVLASVSVFVAQARGAGRTADVSDLYWTGILLALLLSIPAVIALSFTETLLLLVGEAAPLAHAVGDFVLVLRWCMPGALIGMGVLRAFLPAIDAGWLILPVTLAGTVINGVVAYGLIHGAWGLPAIGMRGAAIATVVVMTFMAAALLALTHGSDKRRRFVLWRRPRPDILRAILSLGLPIGATAAVEAGLFIAVALLIGLLGPAALAAQQIALTTISIAFMIPLGLAQAANVRVGERVGASDLVGARHAGLVAIALGAGFEMLFAALSLFAPEQVVGLYIEPSAAETFRLATTLLGVAAVFQVADGVQCVAGGALRGLADTRVPFALAAIGYWGIGFPAAWSLTMLTGVGAPGAWWGLAAGLSITATLLTTRFALRSRRAVVPALLA